MYNPALGTFLTPDPAQSDFNTYRYVGDDPIDSTDPTGLFGPVYGGGGGFSAPSYPCSTGADAVAELTDDQKKMLIDKVSSTAEKVYQFLEKNQMSSKTIEQLNDEVGVAKAVAQHFIETDPAKMGWFDLTAAWFFEVGGAEDTHDGVCDFHFGPDSTIAKDVLNLPAVQSRIANVRDRIRAAKLKGDPNAAWGGSDVDPDKPPFRDTVHFRLDDAVRTVKQMDCATGFLGSYDVIITPRAGDNTLTVTVTNTTGWESGTRFRKPANGLGQNQGVLNDRIRGGGGIHLGGTIRQTIVGNVPYEAP